MQISAILNTKGHVSYSISPDATVFEAISKMAGHNVGSLLVMSQGRLEGIISERDYTRKVALKGRMSRQTPVRDIMVAPVITVAPDDTVEACMRLMTEHRVRHLPVVENGQVVGVISIGDLVNAIISEQTETIHQMQNYIAGQYS